MPSITLISITVCLSGAFACNCPDAWTSFGESCYSHGHESLSFLDAERYCQHRHGHLVHINDATENAFIKAYLEDLKEPNHWIGLTDQDIEGIWQWYDTDTKATYLNWNPGEPNAHLSGNCAVIMANHGYNWVDEPCSITNYHHKTLCERPCLPCAAEVVG